MAAPLRFAIDLFDRISGPAKSASASMAALADRLDRGAGASKAMDAATVKSKIAIAQQALEVPRLQKKLEGLNKELREGAKAQGTFEGWATKLTAVTTAGTAAFRVLSSLGRGAVRFGSELFEVAAGQDATNRAFKNLLGDGGPALQKYLTKIEGATAFTANQLEDLVLPLARQGFGVGEIQRLLPAALDVQARGGSASDAIEKFVKIASTGNIGDRDFKELGLSAESTLANIGRVAGISDRALVEKAISAGKVTSSQILEGVLLSVAKGGEIGDAAFEASKSAEAALRKFKAIPETLFSALGDSDALPKLTKALSGLTTVLTSQKMVDGLVMVATKLAEALGKIDWAVVGSAAVKVIDAFVSMIPHLANLLTFGAIGDDQFDKIKAQGGWRGAVAHVPFARMLLDTDEVAGAPSANDFLARSDGSILRINSADDVLGFKPGGPVESAMVADGARGGGNTVHLTFGDIHVGAGAGSREDVRAMLRAVVSEVWTDYAVEGGAA